MTNRILLSAAFLITGLSLATPPAQGAEPDADMRAGARLLVSLEEPMAKRDLKSYCAARNGSPEYAGYVMRACQAFVKNNLKKAEDCSEAAVGQEIRKDTDRCLAMSDGEFDKEMLIQRRGRENFTKRMKENGIDGEKLLQEERAKLR